MSFSSLKTELVRLDLRGRTNFSILKISILAIVLIMVAIIQLKYKLRATVSLDRNDMRTLKFKFDRVLAVVNHQHDDNQRTLKNKTKTNKNRGQPIRAHGRDLFVRVFLLLNKGSLKWHSLGNVRKTKKTKQRKLL